MSATEPAMSATEPAPSLTDAAVCITCSDEGRLAEVVRPGDVTSLVRTARGDEEVDTTLVGPLTAGDHVLVHAGVAITTLDAEAARRHGEACG